MLGAHGGLSTGCHPGPIPPCDSVLKAQGGGSGPCSRPRKAVPPAGVSLASGLRRPEAPSQRQNRHRVGPARGGFFLGPQLGHATAWAGVPAMGGPALPYPGLGCPCYCLCVEATRSGVFQQGPHLSGVWPSPHSPHPGQSWGHGLSTGCSSRASPSRVCLSGSGRICPLREQLRVRGWPGPRPGRPLLARASMSPTPSDSPTSDVNTFRPRKGTGNIILREAGGRGAVGSLH